MEKKEAMKILKDFHDKSALFSVRTALDTIIPELKESEDERIRKMLIYQMERWHEAALENNAVQDIKDSADAITWLEKQGEKEKFIEKELGCIHGYREEALRRLQELEKQKEPEDKGEISDGTQAHVDKVEPRFHEGDWVVVSTTKGDRVVQIASVEYFKNGHPSYITTEGRWFGNGIKARLLTDKDVETTTIPESRVIVSKNKSWSEEDEQNLNAALSYINDEHLRRWLKDNIYNKYEKPTWSEKDEKLLKLSLENLTELKNRFDEEYGKVGDCINWLKSIKDRIQPKQEWSEEDEAMFQGVIETEQYMLDVVYGRKIFAVGNEDIKEECTKELSWLNSIKDRIK